MTVVEKLFASSLNLPSLPEIVQRMIASLADEDVDIASLLPLLRKDQALAARVLRLANSGFYGASKKIGALDEALTLIGLNALRNIVIASGVASAFPKVGGVELRPFWDHANLAALCAQQLASKLRIHPELCYTAALMHGIGQLLAHIAWPEPAAEVHRQSAKLSPAERASVEQAQLGCTHCELGAELARRWNFPSEIQNALRWYVAPLDDMASAHALIVHVAVHIATGIEGNTDKAVILATLPAAVQRRFGLSAEALESEIQHCQALALKASA